VLLLESWTLLKTEDVHCIADELSGTAARVGVWSSSIYLLLQEQKLTANAWETSEEKDTYLVERMTSAKWDGRVVFENE